MLIKLKLLTAAAFIILLTACQNGLNLDETAAHERAVALGYLLPQADDVVQSVFETSGVTLGNVGATLTQPVGVTFLRFRHLYFETPNRELYDIYIERGAWVNEGDVLASLIPLNREEAERLFIRRDNIIIELERFDRDFYLERDRRMVELSLEAYAIYFAEDDEWQRLALELARREIAFEQWQISQAQAREGIADRLDALLEQIAGDQIIAPMDGFVSFVGAFAPGAFLAGWQRMFTIVDDLIFINTFPNVASQIIWNGHSTIYRHGDILPMTMAISVNHHEHFDVRVASDPRATGARTAMRYMLVPADWDAFSALLEEYQIDLTAPPMPTFSVQLSIEFENVLKLPTRAVRYFSTVQSVSVDSTMQQQTIHHHYVYIYENAARRRQNIVTGMVCTRSGYTEILSGLSYGQRVVVW